jgi:polysaccharide export outer membrane protein
VRACAARGKNSFLSYGLWGLLLGLAMTGHFLGQTDSPAAGSGSADPAAYLIGKEDILKIMVYQEQNLSLDAIPVRPDGKISLPLLGDVVAAGETPEGLAQKLTQMYEAHVRAPAVTVMVTEINSFKVFILGKIGAPGILQFGRETRLLQALAMAGGFTDFANTKRILIIREEGGAQRRIEVNYEKIISGQNMEMNLKLKPGDTIVVP